MEHIATFDRAAGRKEDQRHQFLAGSTLKIIAMATMLLDHFAASVLFVYLEEVVKDPAQWEKLYDCYHILRSVGRTAFPIYCFLLCEGLIYTHSRAGYARRLLIFAAVSEIPYNLTLVRFDLGRKQNVFFTLLIGYLVIWGLHEAKKRMAGYPAQFAAAAGLLILGGACLADFLKTDYGARGILLIVILYVFREKRILAGAVGYLSFLWEAWCFPAFLLIQFYNGKRGLPLKYIFYFFYPVHLLLLYGWMRMIAG